MSEDTAGGERACTWCREAISARLDGAGQPGEGALVDAHLTGCAGCRHYAERAAQVTRLTRTRAVEQVPDLVAAVLAAAPRGDRRRPGGLRIALAAVGIGQLGLAVNGVLTAGAAGGHLSGAAGTSVAHFSHESAAWNLALAVAFLSAASTRSRIPGLVPVLTAFVGAIALLSAVDLAGGRVEPGRLAGHAVVLVGLVLVVALHRAAGGDGRPPRAHRGRTPGSTPGRPGSRARFTRPRAVGDDGLAPSAHHRAA